MPQIQIPSPLRQYSGKQASVDVPGKTVGEALAGLVSQHPGLKRHLYTDDGKLRAFVNVYVNDEDMRYLEKEATALKDGDTISIVPSIAGGRDTTGDCHIAEWPAPRAVAVVVCPLRSTSSHEVRLRPDYNRKRILWLRFLTSNRPKPNPKPF